MMKLKDIRICARCEGVRCKCDFGTYSAAIVYTGWKEFLGSRFRLMKVSCWLGRHDYEDIIEDRINMVNLSPEHYTVVERQVCVRCSKERKI